MTIPRVDHVEWTTNDLETLKNFLQELFEWTFIPFGAEYFIYSPPSNDSTVGISYSEGIVPETSSMNVIIEVDSIVEILKKAILLGGSTEKEKTLVSPEIGSCATIKAPDGTRIGLLEKPSV